jgi:diguanylate cyclase (GGDEF)-like protein
MVMAVVTGLDEYQARMMDGVSQVLSGRGLPLVVHATDPYGHGIPSCLAALLRHGLPVGVVTSANSTPEEEREVTELVSVAGIPRVHIGQQIVGSRCVGGDNETGMRQLMHHLLHDCGVRHPALVKGLSHQVDSSAREVFFREEMAAHGLSVDEDLMMEGRFHHDHAYHAMSRLLNRTRDMDAVVALNDESAVGALQALLDAGLRVPDDVVVTGFDNAQVSSRYWPGLTTVDQNLREQGATAARMLLEAIEGGSEPRGEVIPSHLVVRGSTVGVEQEPDGGLGTAISIASSSREMLAAQDSVIGLTRATIRCRTVREVVDVVESELSRLGIDRCFLSLYDRPIGTPVGTPVNVEQARLVLEYTKRQPCPSPNEVFPTHEMLPSRLWPEITGAGTMVMQPLSGAHRELGFVLFDMLSGPSTPAEVLRLDLSRSLEIVVTAQELEEHAATLERLVARRTRELEQANAELHRSLMLDGLTRIANRTALQEHLDWHWSELARNADRLAVLMVDVDLFKPYNDRYGHLAGDHALRIIASCLQRSVRGEDDLAARFGGEEFIVVLPRCGEQAAAAVAARFRRLLAHAAITHEGSTVAPVVTASIGVAVANVQNHNGPATLLQQADTALYQAKALGRDRVVFAGRTGPVFQQRRPEQIDPPGRIFPETTG